MVAELLNMRNGQSPVSVNPSRVEEMLAHLKGVFQAAPLLAPLFGPGMEEEKDDHFQA